MSGPHALERLITIEGHSYRPILLTHPPTNTDSWIVHRLLFGLASKGDWPACQALLVDGGLRSRFGVPPTTQAFAAAMSGAAAVAKPTGDVDADAKAPPDWMAAMRAQGLVPDVMAFNVAIQLQRRLGRWDRAVALLAEAEAAGVGPDVVSYTTAIAACGEAGRWERADELLDAMQSRGVEPTVVTYTALMTAFGRAGELGRCWALRRAMTVAGVAPDPRFYRAAFAALAPAGDEEGCLGLLGELAASCQQGLEGVALDEDPAAAATDVRPRLDAVTYRHLQTICQTAGRLELLALVEGPRGAR